MLAINTSIGKQKHLEDRKSSKKCIDITQEKKFYKEIPRKRDKEEEQKRT